MIAGQMKRHGVATAVATLAVCAIVWAFTTPGEVCVSSNLWLKYLRGVDVVFFGLAALVAVFAGTYARIGRFMYRRLRHELYARCVEKKDDEQVRKSIRPYLPPNNIVARISENYLDIWLIIATLMVPRILLRFWYNGGEAFPIGSQDSVSQLVFGLLVWVQAVVKVTSVNYLYTSTLKLLAHSKITMPEAAEMWSKHWGSRLVVICLLAAALLVAVGVIHPGSESTRLFDGLLAAVALMLWAILASATDIFVKHHASAIDIIRVATDGTDATAYYEYDRLCDLLKTAMFFQTLFCISQLVALLDGTTVIPSIFASNAFQTNLILDGAPVLYLICCNLRTLLRSCLWCVRGSADVSISHWTQLDMAKQCLMYFLFYVSLMLMAITGCGQSCESAVLDKLPKLNHQVYVFIVYYVRATGVPSAMALAMLMLTSPGASRYSVQLHTLPLLMKFPMSLTLWLPPHFAQLLHVMSAAAFCVVGVGHTIGWIVIIAVVRGVPIENVILALVTGVIMLVALVKLAWPPGHQLRVGPILSRMPGWNKFSKFLQDSKYGRWHVYLSALLFVAFCAHGAMAVVRPPSAYVLPVIAFVVLVLMHPAKKAWLRKQVRPFRHYDDFVADFTPYRRDAHQLTPKLSSVRLLCHRPTYHQELDCCDVVLLQPTHRWFDTAHYYSVVTSTMHGKDLDVRLLIQNVGSNGTSHTLAESGDNLKPNVEVIGFVKSHCHEALRFPSVLAVGYESGMAAFTELLRLRREQREIEPRDLLVVWMNFPMETRGDEHNPLLDLALLMTQTVMACAGSRVLFIVTSVPDDFVHPAHKLTAPNMVSPRTAAALLHSAAPAEARAALDLLSRERRSSVSSQHTRRTSSMSSYASVMEKLDLSRASTYGTKMLDTVRYPGFDLSYVPPSRKQSFDVIAKSCADSPSCAQSPSAGADGPTFDNADEVGFDIESNREGSTPKGQAQSQCPGTAEHSVTDGTGGLAVTPEAVWAMLDNPDNFFPFRDYIYARDDVGTQLAESKVRAKLEEVFDPARDENYSVLFLPELQNRSELISQFKYDLYYHIGQIIVKQFVRSLKRHATSLHEKHTACAVLYSGEYAQSKMGAYHDIVQQLQREHSILPWSKSSEDLSKRASSANRKKAAGSRQDRADDDRDENCDVYVRFILDG